MQNNRDAVFQQGNYGWFFFIYFVVFCFYVFLLWLKVSTLMTQHGFYSSRPNKTYERICKIKDLI